MYIKTICVNYAIDDFISCKLSKRLYAEIVRSGFLRSLLRSALQPQEYTPLRAPGYIFFRSILCSAPSLGAEFRSAPTLDFAPT